MKQQGKNMKSVMTLGSAAIGLIFGCKKAYNPPVVSGTNSYLVVEGVINSGTDSTIIKLSKTVNIAGDVTAKPVDGSTITVEDEQGSTNVLEPVANGRYVAARLNIDASKKYRLHITTADKKDYASDYVEVKNTPAIDDISYSITGNKLQIYADAHDATNSTRYYRWDYTEAWRFHANYQTDQIVDSTSKAIRGRNYDELGYYCFANDVSSTIVLGTSAKLAQDVIAKAPITAISSSSEKVQIRYSILLKQYALTKEAYQFWDNLKKNTEQLGSIFDAQPTQLTGNIHNINDTSEPVIGYISITNVQSKRIFIDNSQVPQSWYARSPYNCELDSGLYINGSYDQYVIKGRAFNNPITPALDKEGNLLGYLYSSLECTDCRVRGKVKAPTFWIEK